MIFLQRFHRPVFDVGHVAIVFFVVVRQKMADQFRNVFAPLAQRRQVNRHHVQSIVQVFAKFVFVDQFLQIAIAGGDHAHIDANRLRIADALELALLQHAQQLHLQLRRGGIDFVQKNRAGVRRFESARAIGDRAGERAAHVAEQFAFQQTFAQRAAIHAHKRARAARAKLMHRLGDQFLARAGFAQQQHRGVRLAPPAA